MSSSSWFTRCLLLAAALVPGSMAFSISDVASNMPHLHSNAGLDQALSAYQHALSTNPLPTKMITGATLAVTGDALAQSQNKAEPYDKRRALSFAVFDMMYRALQHAAFPLITAQCHGQYLGALHVPTDVAAAMEQTLASQLGIVPFMYYPVFFSLTALLQGLDAPAGWERAQQQFLPLMKRNLLFWIPVQYVQFGYVPEEWQIPFLSVAGLAWTCILSLAAGSAKAYAPKAPEDEESSSTGSAVPQPTR